MNKELPSLDELPKILSYISYSDFDTWYKTFLACGRMYPNDPAAFSICQSWAGAYSKRTKGDEKIERYAFYTGSKQRSGVDVGWLMSEAFTGGYRNSVKNNYFDAPFSISVKSVPDITGVINGALEQGNDFEPKTMISKQILSAVSKVLDFWVYNSLSFDKQRLEFMEKFNGSLHYIPEPARLYFQALGDHLNIIDISAFDSHKFIKWGEANKIGFKGEQLQDLCALDKGEDFDEITSPKEACEYMEQAITKAWHLVISQQALELSQNSLTNGLLNDVVESKSKTKAQISKLTSVNNELDEGINTLRAENIASEAKKAVLEIVDPRNEGRVYLRTGYEAIDRHIYGFRRGETTIMAAHSGVGKTWFGLDVAKHVTQMGKRVLFISTEMPNDQLAERLAMNVGGAGQDDLQNMFNYDAKVSAQGGGGGNSFASYFDGVDNFFSAHNGLVLKASQLGGFTIEKIKSEVSQESKDSPLDLVVVDYLQNVSSEQFKDDKAQWERINFVMSELTRLASECHCAILILAQLNNPNRKKEGANSEPNLYDIAGASGVVHDAAAVLMMYKAIADGDQGHLVDLRLSITKSRYGALTSAPLNVFREKGGRYAFSV